MKTAVKCDNLYFRYHKEYILENITLKIEDGEYIAIIGPNGGGKSTLLRLIMGLLKPTKGSIAIYGQSPQRAKRVIGYLPQKINFGLDMPITAFEAVLQGRLSGSKLFYDEEDKKTALRIMENLGVANYKDSKISELSGGERQKILLARALACDPKILILDEPTASVDIEGQKQIYEILKNLNMTKIVVSHDIKILFEGVDRVAYINRRLYMHDSPDLNIEHSEGHFCEMELFEYLKKGCDV